MQPQPPPPLLHALHNRPNLSNNNNNNASLGPMKQQVTFEIDGRPSLGGGEEILTEDEARRRREQLNRRPSYRQILKDLETVGDKPIKREMLEDPSTHHLRGGLNGAGRSLGVNGHVDGGHSSYGSPLSTSDGPTGDEPSAATPPPTQTAVLTAPPPQLSSANPLLSAAVAASLMLPGTVAGTISSSGDLIGGLKPLSAAVAGGGGASTMDAADALSAAVSAAAVSSAFSHGNDWNGLDWKNSLLYSNHQSAGPPLIGGGGAGVGLVQANTPGSITSSHSDNDDNNRKRQVRLLKNREAAKECRRKKKEYVKCLENRVGVLENQNKALIEELKTLKELYCRKEKSELP